MTPLLGVTTPNTQWRTWTHEEEAALLDLRPQALLVLGYPVPPDNPDLVELQRAQIEQAARLWRALGRPRFYLRPYGDRILQRPPLDWSFECYVLVQRYKAAGIQGLELIPWNEPNLAGEGGGEDWERVVLWETACAADLKMRLPGTRLHRPAFSPTGGYVRGFQKRQVRQPPGLFEIDDAHVYTDDQIADVEYINSGSGLPVCITEWNRLVPSALVAALPEYCEAAVYFILRWDRPEPGVPVVDLIGWEYYEDFKAAAAGALPPQEVGEMALVDQYPEQFSQWQAAGGVENNFRKHLLGIGVLAPEAADLLFLAQELGSGIQQLRGVLDAYPFP
mgnify:CR=1 FL=1